MPDLAPRRWWSSFAAVTVLIAVLVGGLVASPATETGLPLGRSAEQQGTNPTPAQGTSPSVVTWTPPIVFSDEPVLVEMELTGIFTHVFIDTTGGVFPTDTANLPAGLGLFLTPITQVLQLFDDGTNGDAVPGDDTWSRGGILINPASFIHNGGTHQTVAIPGLIFYDDRDVTANTFGTIGSENFNGLHVVNASQRGTVTFTELQSGELFTTSHALFLVDNGTFFPNPAAQFSSETIDFCGACRLLIERFGDEFDFVLLEGVQFLTDPEARSNQRTLAFHTARRNDVEGIGRSVFNENNGPIIFSDGSMGNTFSQGRLLGIIFNNAVSGTPLTHEIMHQFALPNDRFLTFLDGTGHYANTSDIVGIMDTGIGAASRPGSPFDADFVANGDGTFRLVSRIGGSVGTFSPISLYLAGFIGPNQVPPITSFTSSPDLSNPDRVLVASTVVETVDDFIAAFGPRVPTSATAPRNFTLGTAVVHDEPYTEAEYTWITLVLRNLESNRTYDGFGPAPWRAATLGASTITTALPGQQQPEPEPEPQPEPEPEPEPVPLGETFTVPILRGFNLVGWMGGTAVEDATATLNADFDTLFAFDPFTELFSTYSPTAPGFLNDLDELEAGMGMWVLSNGPGEWEMPRPEQPLSIPLQRGFSLVVWSGEHEISTADAIASLGSALDALFVWDPLNQRFLSYSPSAPAFLNDASNLFFGEGVWVLVNRNVTWNQGN